MDSPPVSFGRRGLEHHDDTWSAPPQGVARTAHSGDRAAPVPPGRMPVAPDEVVGRSLAKVVSFAAFLWLVMMLTGAESIRDLNSIGNSRAWLRHLLPHARRHQGTGSGPQRRIPIGVGRTKVQLR